MLSLKPGVVIHGPGNIIERNGLTHPNKDAVNRRRIHG